MEKVYRLLEAGEVSIHDDRHRSRPWGILGGRPGGCSEKWLVRADGSREQIPSKVDNVRVEPGDRIVFRTAGGGGWGDALERDPAVVRRDVVRGLLTAEAAREGYGVALNGDGKEVDRSCYRRAPGAHAPRTRYASHLRLRRAAGVVGLKPDIRPRTDASCRMDAWTRTGSIADFAALARSLSMKTTMCTRHSEPDDGVAIAAFTNSFDGGARRMRTAPVGDLAPRRRFSKPAGNARRRTWREPADNASSRR